MNFCPTIFYYGLLLCCVAYLYRPGYVDMGRVEFYIDYVFVHCATICFVSLPLKGSNYSPWGLDYVLHTQQERLQTTQSVQAYFEKKTSMHSCMQQRVYNTHN